MLNHLHSLCLTRLCRLLSSLTTEKGTDPSCTLLVERCLVFTGERVERDSTTGNAIRFFFLFERRFWGGVVLSSGLLEPDWTMQYQILRAWPFPI